LRNRGYAVRGWGQGRNFGPRPGVQSAMTELLEEINDSYGRKVRSSAGASVEFMRGSSPR
jgi:hypothetical protein